MRTKTPLERATLPRALLVLSSIAALAAAQPARAESVSDQTATGDLKRLSVEDLMDVQVTSVSKQAEPVNGAAAAIYVITHEDIVRSGATSIPEILRLAPNLHVVQLSPSSYTITARGFSGNSSDQNFSDKLLVLIDGRSVYSPLFSGVYWDAQDTMLEDIDRIEVISGPGATLWGANAVNGVINVITRSSADTQGLVVSAGGGSLEKDAGAQLGGQIGEASLRVYAKAFKRNAFEASADGPSADDGWSKGQVGFRGDWRHGMDQLSVQGDVYRGNESGVGGFDTTLSGANLVTHWQRALSDTSSLQLLGYYDQSERFTIGTLGGVLNTYDLELQHSFLLGRANEIVWGAGERINRYDITNVPIFQFAPAGRTLNLADVFAQDSIALAANLKLTIGLKLEDDPYSGATPLPSARLSWKLTDNALLWSAISRAIRSPTPFDRDVREYLGGQLFLEGGPDFKPEKLTAYELGYRAQLGHALSFSVSTFYNVYDDLRSLEISPATLLPLQWGNEMKGDTFGVELWGNYQLLDWWRLAFGFNQQYENLSFQPGSSQLLGIEQAGDDPGHQASLRSSMTLAPGWLLDADLRYVGSLPQPAVPAYEELNVHLGWQISSHWDAALSGFNLLHAHHVEFMVPPSDAISRSVLVSARLKL
ncbi:MAG TPA: TonB-dependent receptor [Steroidobacteraceae bacterium]|jgi:iron complex outermembrane receptor protein